MEQMVRDGPYLIREPNRVERELLAEIERLSAPVTSQEATMLPPPTFVTLAGFFLAAFGAAIGWYFGLFVITQITRAIVGAF